MSHPNDSLFCSHPAHFEVLQSFCILPGLAQDVGVVIKGRGLSFLQSFGITLGRNNANNVGPYLIRWEESR